MSGSLKIHSILWTFIYNGQADFSKLLEYKDEPVKQQISHVPLSVTYPQLGEGRKQRNNSSAFPTFQFTHWRT